MANSADSNLFKSQISVFPFGTKQEVRPVARERSKCGIVKFGLDREIMTKKNTITNKNYAVEVAHTLQHTRLLLSILGVWPMLKNDAKKWEIRASKVLMALCFILLAFIAIPPILHMSLREKNRLVIVMLCGPIGFCVTNIIKYCIILFRCGMLKRCMEHIELDWMRIETANDREIMTRNINIGRKLTIICAFFMYTGGISYHVIMPLCRGKEMNEFNETLRPVIYPGFDIFIDPQKSPTYEMIFYTNCFSSCVMNTVTTVACNLASTFVSHTCGQIEITMSRLENFFNNIDETNEAPEKRFDFVVENHVRILRLATMIETLLREICLVEVLASIIIICLVEYHCLAEWTNSETIAMITYVELFMSFSFNIFIFCYIGEVLQQQCCQIGEAAYMIDWHRLPGKTGTTLVLIIAMADIPRKLTAGGIMELTISNFGDIIKSSMVYFNILRTMTY